MGDTDAPVLAVNKRSAVPPTYPLHPMPGDVLGERTVVASIHFGETDEGVDTFTVLLLNPMAPFYTVAIIEPVGDNAYRILSGQHFRNIVPAVQDGYTQMGGDY